MKLGNIISPSISSILLGIMIGIFLAVSISFVYDVFLLSHKTFQSYSPLANDTSEIHNNIRDLKTANINNEEKIGSLNKRFDDLLIFGGIIITLLLAINLTVYVKTESEVDKYFKKHFKEYESKIQIVNKNADSLYKNTVLLCEQAVNKAQATVQALEELEESKKIEKEIGT
jgi:hypothetical protein